jgi:hypothetical protein
MASSARQAVEAWRDIEWAPNYSVSNFGNVKGPRGCILKERVDRGGYRRVAIYVDGKPKHTMIHRLTCTAFVGARPDGHEVNHKNCIRHDNRAENLEWVTRQQNAEHRQLHGIHQRGEQNGNARLTQKQADRLREIIAGGARRGCAATVYGISKSMVGCIARGQNWTKEMTIGR